MSQTEREILVDSILPVGAREAEAQSIAITHEFVDLLRDLQPPEWDLPTDCERWTVRDVASHVLGWDEAVASLPEMGRQSAAALRRIKEFGNIVDAQNQVQVEARSSLPADGLIARLETAGTAAAIRRRKLAGVLGRVPMYMSYMGGWITTGYLLNAIMPRDILVHRIDVARATARPLVFSAEDRRVVEDIVRDWFARSGAQVRLVLDGEMDLSVVSSQAPVATLQANAVDWVRFLFGRADKSAVHVEGDQAAASAWLGTFFPV